MTEPYKYQKQGVLLMHKKFTTTKHNKKKKPGARVLLADPMGLGKTIQGLWYLKKYKDIALPAVVVCPSVAKYVWEDQSKDHIHYPAEVLGTRSPPQQMSAFHPQILIINYDVLHWWVKYLRKTKPKTVILDEVQYMSNLGVKGRPGKKGNPVKRTRAVLDLCKGVPNIIGMSGTPFKTAPKQLWNILHLLRPDIWKSYPCFAFRYCNRKKSFWGGWDDTGSSHSKELHKKMRKHVMIRRRKKDVLPDLPPKQRFIVPLEIEHPKEYREACVDFLGWLGKQSITKAKKAEKAKALVQQGALLQLAAKLKMKEAIRWIDNFLECNPGEKIAVFFVHKATRRLLEDHYKGRSVSLHGGTSHKNRRLAVRAFQTKKSIDVFLGNIQAAGQVITLTAAAVMAVVELPRTRSPGDMLQVEDRIWRIGQERLSSIYYLVAKGTIEEKICKVLQKRQEVFSEVMEGDEEIEPLDLYNIFLGHLQGDWDE